MGRIVITNLKKLNLEGRTFTQMVARDATLCAASPSVQVIRWVNLADRWGSRRVSRGKRAPVYCDSRGTALGWAKPDAVTMTYINN